MSAFRCKTCGHLHAAGHAGENDIPHACAVCGAGVSFTPRGTKTFQPDNWEVLADATPERLAELGLVPEQVARHAGKGGKPNPKPKHVRAEAADGSGVKDKA
jgi:hypothetical protein